MHGSIPPFIVAEAIMIMAWRFLVLMGPFLAVVALAWFIHRIDRIINYLFPYLEWEKSLGWFNIRAERRANMAVRCVGYAVYVLLVAALYGVLWAALGFQSVSDWSDPAVLADLAFRGTVLGVCLGSWLVYLGAWLIPKLRAQREEIELKRFRAQMEEVEKEREKNPRSRVQSPLAQPRTNSTLVGLTPDHLRRRRQPGG